jgi:phage terminase large subunit-like protein
VTSLAERIVSRFAALPNGGALLEQALGELSVTELVALQYDWDRFWARPKQLIRPGRWRSWGFLTGRGFGKTRAISSWIQAEVYAGRAMRIALMAQNEDKTYEVMVEGESGLIATSPPWFKATLYKGRVVWPNGAQAFVYTPEVPDGPRGPEHHLAWVSELVAWPQATRDEAFKVLRFGLRLGYARMVWDTTPKRRHPLIRYMLSRAERNPETHVIVRGTMMENIANLSKEEVDAMLAEYGGTRAGREELYGEFFDEAEGALWQQAWIDRARRSMPTRLKRRIISIDPAISDKKGTDNTGIADLGLGLDDQVLVIGDFSGRHSWEDWGAWTVDHYMRQRCDCVVVETDRGGDGIAANIRACARARGFEVQVVKLEAPTRHNQQTIYIKEVRSRQRSKEGRARPVATLAEGGRISHVRGGELEWGTILATPAERSSPSDLSSLEDTLTTWEPDGVSRSPDDLDAMVHGVWELTNLWNKDVDHRAGFKGIGRAAEQLDQTVRKRRGASLSSLLGQSEWGDKL